MTESYSDRLEEKEQTENALVNERENLKPEEESNRKFGRLSSRILTLTRVRRSQLSSLCLDL